MGLLFAFIGGMIAGGIIGMVIMALAAAASHEDMYR